MESLSPTYLIDYWYNRLIKCMVPCKKSTFAVFHTYSILYSEVKDIFRETRGRVALETQSENKIGTEVTSVVIQSNDFLQLYISHTTLKKF